jgi:hypothetical protein
MNYGQMHEVFQNKVKAYDRAMCEFALRDCHEALAINKDMATDHPYYIKLWAEIDAIRERQLKISKVAA